MHDIANLSAGRFVILQHDHPQLHWDFLLETPTAARTWRLLQYPEPGKPISALRIPDHRLLYLTYEGPVSGGRGTVSRIDAGHYEVDSTRHGILSLTLQDSVLAARADLLEQTSTGDTWMFVAYRLT